MSAALALLSAFLLLAGCGGETPTPVAPTIPAPTSTLAATPLGATTDYITDIVLAKTADAKTYAPLDSPEHYPSTGVTLYAVVLVNAPPKGAQVWAEWYLLKAQGFKSNSLIDKTGTVVPDSNVKQLSFALAPKEKKWPPGDYRVDIYADNRLAVSKKFSIGDSTPVAAGPEVVKQIVLAQDVTPITFEPVNTTTEFSKSAPAIYVAVQIENSPPGTVYRVRWYPPGMEPLEKELQPGPSLWLESHLIPADSGFPGGDYKVELYQNGQLVDTRTFTVK
jgi:hypothetical protein